MISIVIPVYNSEKTLEQLCQKIINVMTTHERSYEIILVDDSSCDRSFQIMKGLSKRHKQVTSIRLLENVGQQNALLCGLRHTKGDSAVTIDDDLQQDPEDIMLLMDALQQGYDVVYGVPNQKNRLQYRHVGTQLKELIFRLLLGRPKHVKLTSFRIMNRDTVEAVKKEKLSYIYLSATILRYTKNIGNTQVRHYNRLFGKSNYTMKRLMKLLINVIIYYWNVPLIKGLRKNKPQYCIDEIVNDD